MGRQVPPIPRIISVKHSRWAILLLVCAHTALINLVGQVTTPPHVTVIDVDRNSNNEDHPFQRANDGSISLQGSYVRQRDGKVEEVTLRTDWANGNYSNGIPNSMKYAGSELGKPHTVDKTSHLSARSTPSELSKSSNHPASEWLFLISIRFVVLITGLCFGYELDLMFETAQKHVRRNGVRSGDGVTTVRLGGPIGITNLRDQLSFSDATITYRRHFRAPVHFLSILSAFASFGSVVWCYGASTGCVNLLRSANCFAIAGYASEVGAFVLLCWSFKPYGQLALATSIWTSFKFIGINVGQALSPAPTSVLTGRAEVPASEIQRIFSRATAAQWVCFVAGILIYVAAMLLSSSIMEQAFKSPNGDAHRSSTPHRSKMSQGLRKVPVEVNDNHEGVPLFERNEARAQQQFVEKHDHYNVPFYYSSQDEFGQSHAISPDHPFPLTAKHSSGCFSHLLKRKPLHHELACHPWMSLPQQRFKGIECLSRLQQNATWRFWLLLCICFAGAIAIPLSSDVLMELELKNQRNHFSMIDDIGTPSVGTRLKEATPWGWMNAGVHQASLPHGNFTVRGQRIIWLTIIFVGPVTALAVDSIGIWEIPTLLILLLQVASHFLQISGMILGSQIPLGIAYSASTCTRAMAINNTISPIPLVKPRFSQPSRSSDEQGRASCSKKEFSDSCHLQGSAYMLFIIAESFGTLLSNTISAMLCEAVLNYIDRLNRDNVDGWGPTWLGAWTRADTLRRDVLRLALASTVLSTAVLCFIPAAESAFRKIRRARRSTTNTKNEVLDMGWISTSEDMSEGESPCKELSADGQPAATRWVDGCSAQEVEGDSDDDDKDMNVKSPYGARRGDLNNHMPNDLDPALLAAVKLKSILAYQYRGSDLMSNTPERFYS
eukprot:GHVN01058536.1.p1 GENE.GHVN01058536.1~~GHVN01058536.1.p1  ORF type:complete len:891 (+),score=75.25 GHVN01058536.1:1844-4516(+)